MKTCDEMAQSVLARRDAYFLERRAQSKRAMTAASCLALCAVLCMGIWLGGRFAGQSVQTDGIGGALIPAGELVFTEQYVYQINAGRYSTYIGGKVIAENKLGGKIADVTLTAGWKNVSTDEWLSNESLRGEVYAIAGVDDDIAVALKFIDRGEAVTTTHYYVIVNPEADLSPVEDYLIQPILPGNESGILPE